MGLLAKSKWRAKIIERFRYLDSSHTHTPNYFNIFLGMFYDGGPYP